MTILKSSIRRFLVINVLFVIVLTSGVVLLSHYYLTGLTLYISLLTFPIAVFLIWIIIGKGLSSLRQVTQEVANRAPSHLEPVDLDTLPDEIRPVIDELNKLFYRLKEGFEREKRFAADAAHELRTPLAAIKTQTQVALNTDNLDEKNLALQKILVSVNRSAHTIQQLLTMSKLLSEKSIEHHFDRINLVKIAREILAMLAPAALEKNIELEFDCNLASVYFMGNSIAIGILIRNLVDNAIRYCPPEGHVVVHIQHFHSTLILEVCDDGPGIPAEVRSRVFERFYRVLGNKSPGSGLGLAIVQEIAHLHQAQIVLTSPKHGTGLIVRIIFKI